MQLIEKIAQLFERIKKGDHSVKWEFFDTISVNGTRLANSKEAAQLMQQIYKWADENVITQPDCYRFIQLCHGFIEFLADHFDEANQYLDLACELYRKENDDDGLAATFICKGFMHRSTGEIDLALKYGLQGIEQLKRSGNYKLFLILGAYFIGGIYTETGNLDEALRLFQMGLAVDFPLGIKSMGARLTNGIATVYLKQKRYSNALENFQRSLDMCDDDTEKTFKARGLTDLADYYSLMGNYPLAIQYNEEALELRKEMKVQNASISNYINLGNLYNKQGKFNKAVTVLKLALKLAEEIKVKSKMFQIHQMLSDLYLGMGEYADGLAHFKAFHEIKEEVNHEDIDSKVRNQVELFQAQLTQKENAIIKAQKLEIERKNIELQETIDELTLAKISKKARALTLSIGIVLFIFQDNILERILHLFASDNYFLALFIKVAIIFSLEPVNKAIENYLLRRVIKKQKREVAI